MRTYAGWSQRYVARMLLVGDHVLGRFERGEAELDPLHDAFLQALILAVHKAGPRAVEDIQGQALLWLMGGVLDLARNKNARVPRGRRPKRKAEEGEKTPTGGKLVR